MAGLFSALLDRMGSTPKAAARLDLTRAASSDSTISEASIDHIPTTLSSFSTPPTSVGDSVSISSTFAQVDSISQTPQQQPDEDAKGRSRRQRTSVTTYNVKVLTGTAIHAPRKYLKNRPLITGNVRRRTMGDELFLETPESASMSIEKKDVQQSVSSRVDALNLEWPGVKNPKPKKQIGPGRPRKIKQTPDFGRGKAGYKSTTSPQKIIKPTSVLGKRQRQSEDSAVPVKVKRELRNLADTNEFAKIETRPVVTEVWSNGKLVTHPPVTKVKASAPIERPSQVDSTETPVPVVVAPPAALNRKKEKHWLSMGLYAGQGSSKDLNWFNGVKLPTEDVPPFKPTGVLPLPVWHGQRLLFIGRDFKLPFDVCSPLPPGQPKPEGWGKTSSNRFVGDAGLHWKSDIYGEESKCVCTEKYGCDEHCLNIVMKYECDSLNCAFGDEGCNNRSFAELQKRRKHGGKPGNKFQIGVEVLKTADRGYGVRSNRCFEPGQIIVEYTGEIITEEECDRRMNEDYKNNDCYYLMSFDQHMIIDATKGSIARFVNHSCQPNCHMVKWIVGRKPRMALFAGDKPIMSGDELTYDYNFDPFSAKNVQECRCGSANCRGVLGPKPKDVKPVKPVKETIKAAVKATLKAGKRSLAQFLSGDASHKSLPAPKKRKTKKTAPLKSTTSTKKKSTTSTTQKSGKPLFRRTHTVTHHTSAFKIAAKKKKKPIVRTYSRPSKVIAKAPLNLAPSSSQSTPRANARQSSSEVPEDVDDDDFYVDEDDDGTIEASIRTSGRKRRSIFKEESGTIHVVATIDREE